MQYGEGSEAILYGRDHFKNPVDLDLNVGPKSADAFANSLNSNFECILDAPWECLLVWTDLRGVKRANIVRLSQP